MIKHYITLQRDLDVLDAPVQLKTYVGEIDDFPTVNAYLKEHQQEVKLMEIKKGEARTAMTILERWLERHGLYLTDKTSILKPVVWEEFDQLIYPFKLPGCEILHFKPSPIKIPDYSDWSEQEIMGRDAMSYDASRDLDRARRHCFKETTYIG